MTTHIAAMAKATLQHYIDAFNAGDAKALTALFADDGVIIDPVGIAPKQGKALAEWFEEAVGMGIRMQLAAPIRGSKSNCAAAAIIATMPQDGQLVTVNTLDVIAVNEQGKILNLSAYWGEDDFSSAPL